MPLEPGMSIYSRKVSVRYLQIFCEVLESFDINPLDVLRHAGLDSEMPFRLDAKWVHADVERFVSAAIALSGRSDLGFEMGLRTKMNSHDVLGYGLISCPTMDDFWRLASRHYHLLTETWTLKYYRWNNAGEAVYTPLVAMSPGTLHFQLEFLAVAHHNQQQLTLGQDHTLSDFYLAMPPPPHAQRYRSLAPSRFHFIDGLAPSLRVLMPSSMLELPLPLANERVMQEIDERCQALGRKPPRSDIGWSSYILMTLRESHGESLTLEDIARRVDVSTRTIDRNLQKEGTSFRALSDKVRFETACELLLKPGVSVSEVAARLGFSEISNFSRSFKRVVGITPSQYMSRLHSD